MRILIVSSVPLASPWNGADKNLARLLALNDRENEYIVQSDLHEAWPGERIEVVRERVALPQPVTGQKIRAMAFMIKHAQRADLIHIVSSVRKPGPLIGPFLRLFKSVSRRPLLHTAPSVGDGKVRGAHFPADATVVISRHVQTSLKEAGVKVVFRIMPPLDFSVLDRSGSNNGAAALMHPGDRTVLYAGHYGPYGGVAECIKAFARLPEELDDAVLVLACRTYPGQDAEVEARQARSLAAAAGIAERVRVVGEVENMPALISACTLTALVPRRLEGKMAIPQVLLETLALDRPIITGSEPPLSEALFGGGVAVPPGDVPALTDAMARLLLDPGLRKQLARAGREAVREQCAPEAAVREYQQIYRQLTGLASFAE